jgi:hypothetical protein
VVLVADRFRSSGELARGATLAGRGAWRDPLVLVDTEARIQALRAAERDVREAGRIEELILSVGEPAVSVQLQIDRAAGLGAPSI